MLLPRTESHFICCLSRLINYEPGHQVHEADDGPVEASEDERVSQGRVEHGLESERLLPESPDDQAVKQVEQDQQQRERQEPNLVKLLHFCQVVRIGLAIPWSRVRSLPTTLVYLEVTLEFVTTKCLVS